MTYDKFIEEAENLYVTGMQDYERMCELTAMTKHLPDGVQDLIQQVLDEAQQRFEQRMASKHDIQSGYN